MCDLAKGMMMLAYARHRRLPLRRRHQRLGPRGIRVNAIAPGTVDTAMRRKSIENLPAAAQAELKAYVERSYPLGRIGQTSDLAGIAVYLASDEAAWTSGGIFAIDGGYTAG